MIDVLVEETTTLPEGAQLSEPLRRPTNLDEFVQNMAYHDMFIFTALE